jgi:hypothetical protein
MRFMSSPRTAKIARRAAIRTPPAAKPAKSVQRRQAAAKPASKTVEGDGSSTEAKRLAAELERALAGGRRDALSTEALQALMAAACKTYAAQDLRRASRSGRAGAAASRAWRRHGDRGDDHGERAAQSRQPRRIRTRHVAELDWALDSNAGKPARNCKPFWKRQETNDGPPR